MKVVELLAENYRVALLNSKNSWRILGQESYAYETAQWYGWDMTATKEVGDAIRDIQNGTRKNVGNVEQVVGMIDTATTLASTSGEALNEIVELVDATAQQVQSIATAAEEQSSTSEEINRSIEDVNRISLETSSAMSRSSSLGPVDAVATSGSSAIPQTGQLPGPLRRISGCIGHGMPAPRLTKPEKRFSGDRYLL